MVAKRNRTLEKSPNIRMASFASGDKKETIKQPIKSDPRSLYERILAKIGN